MNFKTRAEKSMYFGKSVAEMSRDELLIVIGHLGELLEFQGGQLHQAATNQAQLAETLAATSPAQSASPSLSETAQSQTAHLAQ